MSVLTENSAWDIHTYDPHDTEHVNATHIFTIEIIAYLTCLFI